MHICIISGIGVQSYELKYGQAPESWAPLWNKALFFNSKPIDVVDFYWIKNHGKTNPDNENRHIFMNGIVIGNILRRLGAEVNIINLYDPANEEQEKQLERANAVLISSNYVFGKWENQLCNLIDNIKELNDQCYIIIGGYGIYRLFYGDKKEKEKFNIIFEKRPHAIIISRHGIEKAWQTLKNKNVITEGGIVIDTSEFFPTGGDYEIKDWHLDMQSYHRTLVTAQGCPFSCSYCSYKYFIGSPRYTPLNIVFASIRSIADSPKKPLRFLRIADECFNIPNNRAIKICNYIHKARLGFSWCCFLRGDTITDDLIIALKKAGCTMVSIGLESGSEKMQKIFNKNLDLNSVHHSITRLKREGIYVVTSLILGFCGETRESIFMTKRFLEEVSPDLVRINIWKPSPEERKRDIAKEFGFIQDDLGWTHNTMCEKEACELAAELFSSELNCTFVPPFSSVFDQWPELVGIGLSTKDCKAYFDEYYQMATHRLPLSQGLERGIILPSKSYI